MLLLGIITTIVTAGLYHTVIPVSQQLLFKQLLDDPEELLYNMLRRDRCLRHPNMPYVIYVKDVQGKRLIDVVLKKRAKVKDPETGKEVFFGYDFTARIHEARLRVDQANGKLYLDPDRVVLYDKNTKGETARTGPFDMDLPEGLNGKDKIRISAMTWDDLPVRLASLREELAEVEQERDKMRRTAESDPHLQIRHACATGRPHLQVQGGYSGTHHPQHGGGVLPAAGAGGWVPALRATGLPGRHLGEPRRLPQHVRDLLPAGALHLLPASIRRRRAFPRWQGAALVRLLDGEHRDRRHRGDAQLAIDAAL